MALRSPFDRLERAIERWAKPDGLLGRRHQPIRAEPAYQLSSQRTGARTTPDVAYNADPNTGFAVFDSTPYQGQSGWFQLGGTSAGAPQWAAIVALANQSLAKGSLDGASQVLPRLYSLASSTSASSFFHDVTTGNNSRWLVTSGYDGVTGLGSPIASAIVASTSSSTGVVAAAAAQQSVASGNSTQSRRSDQSVAVVTMATAQSPSATSNPCC